MRFDVRLLLHSTVIVHSIKIFYYLCLLLAYKACNACKYKCTNGNDISEEVFVITCNLRSLKYLVIIYIICTTR